MLKHTGRILGKAFRILEYCLAIPLTVLLVIIGRLAAYYDRYAEVSIIASKIPLRMGEYVRYQYYKHTLKHVGKAVVFKYGSFCQYRSAQIGSNVLIGFYTAIGEVNIGDNVITGGFVNFLSGTGQHSYADPSKPIRLQQSSGRKTITIGTDVWIGSNAVIAANVGDRCVVGAGSVLVREADSHSIYAGNPARIINKNN